MEALDYLTSSLGWSVIGFIVGRLSAGIAETTWRHHHDHS